MVTRKKNRTRKSSRRQTVEGLHASFDKLDAKVQTAIKKGCTDSQLASCIRNEWSGLFHTDISTPAVRGMIIHYRAIHKSSKKTRKQRGGMAPVDWTMGQGVTEVYGRFPAEIGTTPQTIRALDLGRFFESNVGRTCNATGGHAQMGGVHYPATVPRNSLEIVGSTLQGAPITNPVATPVSSTANTSTFNPLPYDAKSVMMINTMAPMR